MPFTTSSQEAEQAPFLQPHNPHGTNHWETWLWLCLVWFWPTEAHAWLARTCRAPRASERKSRRLARTALGGTERSDAGTCRWVCEFVDDPLLHWHLATNEDPLWVSASCDRACAFAWRVEWRSVVLTGEFKVDLPYSTLLQCQWLSVSPSIYPECWSSSSANEIFNIYSWHCVLRNCETTRSVHVASWYVTLETTIYAPSSFTAACRLLVNFSQCQSLIIS